MDQECSACGRIQPVDGRYCPYCGANRQASGRRDVSDQPKQSNTNIIRIVVIVVVVFVVIPWLVSFAMGLSIVSYFGSLPVSDQSPQVIDQPTPVKPDTKTLTGRISRATGKPPRHISGVIRTYNGNIPVNTPHQFVSASKYRVPGMKIYVKVGAGVYTYHAAYLSDDGPYCNMRFPDGSIGRIENRVLDGLFTDYVAPK